jgi:hypothetical protein
MDNQEAIRKDIKNYAELKAINNSSEFDRFFKLQIDTVVAKILAVFTGKGPENWDEFCKVRGEIIAMLYPIQEVRGAETMIKHLTEQMNNYYGKSS